MSVEDLCAEAKRLSPEELGDLISRLLSEMGSPDYDVSDEEVRNRIRETREGEVEDVSWDEIRSRLPSIPGVIQ